MSNILFELIDVSELRVGMFVELGLGWMAHPFPSGSFRITSDKQIEVIRGLGLKQIRYVPEKSDLSESTLIESTAATIADDGQQNGEAEMEHAQHLLRMALVENQQRSLLICERHFAQATQLHKTISHQVLTHPQAARTQCLNLINGLLDDMLDQGETSILLLSQGAGDRTALHSVNVSVIALLLGKSMGLARDKLLNLGMASFLHDIGKSELPDRAQYFDDHFSTAQYKVYQSHVELSVAVARRMELADDVLLSIAQHHEMVDGSGFPQHLKAADLTLMSKILALVNRYENLCNPVKHSATMTPHEALSWIFTQAKSRFDGVVLSAFIRMMGVHPPGSVIQLLDGRYAIVVAANTSRPLKPRILVHDPAVPRHKAIILDLEKAPDIGIRRGVKPDSLPVDTLDYLAPRQRICYFFEQNDQPERGGAPA